MDHSLFAFGNFHFASAAWLWGLLGVPLVAGLALLLSRRAASESLLERFADKHLLPLLVRKNGGARRRAAWPLLLWAAAFACGVLAMAGPRWSFTDTQTFAVPDDLVIVLDLSRTMNAQDVKPSRIMRAKQEIQDLLDMRKGAQIGLVAYAAVPHMVTPLTDDIRTIRNLLPELDTSLVMLQGDALKPALEMAATMLRAEPGDAKSILVISDGEFEEADIADLVRAAGGAAIYTMGIGTAAGASGTGPGGETIISRLRTDRLQALAAAGHGLYVEANYTDQDTRAILRRVEGDGARAEAGHGLLRVWDEGFTWPALVLALLLLPFFRRGALLPLALFVSFVGLPAPPANAAAAAVAGKAATNLFLTPDQQARAAFDRRDYQAAMAKFSTAYRRGVAAYRAGAYAKAESYFRAASHQKEGVDALYDLGNAQLMQEKPEDAIVSYKTVLQHRPNDAAALHNLAIAEAMLKQDKQNKNKKPDDKKKDDKKDDKKKDDKNDQNKNNQNKNDQNKNNQDKNNQDQQQKGGQPPPAGQNNQPNNQNNQPPPKQQPGENPPGQNHQGQNQPQKQQPAQQQPAKQQPAQMAQAKPSSNPPPRDQKDVKADEWLGRVRNDPGSFLKNQFMIEDSEHAAQQGAPPQKELP